MKKLAIYIFTFALTACGGGSDNNSKTGDQGKPVPANRVNWDAVPPNYNPRVDDTGFSLNGAERVEVNMSGFNSDVEVVYADLPAGTGLLKVYRVFKDSASWGSLQPQLSGTTLNLKTYGTYECSISIRNGAITDLKGGCYVRVQIYLPNNAQVEVYNVGQLLTKRFVPVTTEIFLTNLRRATWAEQKFAVISDYVSSYANVGGRPAMTSAQLKTALREFNHSDEKLKALTQLQAAVTDRENLKAVLDFEFSFRDREEARRITGV